MCMYNYIFSPLYGQDKWLDVFLDFILNYTLYAQYKWLYVLNYTNIIWTQMFVHLKLYIIGHQKAL